MDLPALPDIVKLSVMAKQKQNRHVFHLKRLGFFSLLLAAFFLVHFDAGNSIPGMTQRTGNILAYASEMSRSALLSGTNASRAANGLAPLAISAELNASAQMKGEHMGANDYWAHEAPDGTTPWFFFQAVGYNYIRAGENLAYGFTTSQGVIDGWMNSPSHRDNMLGNYNDVGFGIVNVSNYQSSGNQTIVVAHYGSRNTPPPAPVQNTTPSTPSTPAPTPAPTPTPTPAPADTTEPAKPVDETATEEKTQTPADKQPETPAAPVKTSSPEKVSVLSMLASNSAPFIAIISLILATAAVLGYAITHRAAFEHAITTGEHFVFTHPGIDTTVVGLMVTLILLTTYGQIG